MEPAKDHLDIIELHSDPDDNESYALLDRQWSHKKPQNSKKDRRKFDKIITRKDEEIKVLTAKVQQQTDASEVVESLMKETRNSVGVYRQKNCLSTLTITPTCMIIVCVLLFVIIPSLGYLVYKFYL